MSIRIGVAPGAWEWTAGGESFFRFVEASEALGWDSLWLTDRVISEQLSLEPVTALAAVAARTSKIKLGTAVIALPFRNPVVLAKELATVDFLSGGRLLLAVGLGTDEPREMEAFSVPKKERAGRTDEAIGLLRRLWREDGVTHHGTYFHLTNVTVRPKPLFRPFLPIWIGGRTEYALKRVARVGDGWLASSVTPQEVARSVTAIKENLVSYGRSIENDHYGVMLPVYLSGSKVEALSHLPAGVGRARTDVPIEEYGAFGTAEDIHARIKEYIEAGASKFVLRLTCTEHESPEQLRGLARHVVVPVNTGVVDYLP